MRLPARFGAAAAIALALGCGSVPACPPALQNLADYFPDESSAFWFDDAIVHTGYHSSTIAPVEILAAPEGHYFADHLEMADELCMSEERLQATLGKSPYVKISGHGRYVEEPRRRFVIDCVCASEPMTETPELKKLLEPLFPR